MQRDLILKKDPREDLYKKLIKMSNKKFDEFMCKTFPDIFQDRHGDTSKTRMCDGFCINKGWHGIVYSICEKLEFITKETGWHVVAVQVKQKLGQLRFYEKLEPNTGTKDYFICKSIIINLTNFASEESIRTCEFCNAYSFVSQLKVFKSCKYSCCDKCHKKLIDGKIKEIR